MHHHIREKISSALLGHCFHGTRIRLCAAAYFVHLRICTSGDRKELRHKYLKMIAPRFPAKLFLLLQTLLVCFAVVSAKINIPRACTGEHADYRFCDPKLSMDERVKDLISRLNDSEKPYLLTARESPKGSIPRLGIPEYDWGGNCIHGVQSRCGSNFTRCPTSFPDPVK